MSPPQHGSWRARLARNTLWSVGGAVASQGSSLAAAILLGRILGVSDFGRIAFIQATVLLVGTIGEMGLGLTVTKFTARWHTLEPLRAGRLIGSALRITACCAVVVAAALAGVGLTGVFGEAVPPAALRAACLLLLFDMLNRIQTSALAGIEAFETAARLNVCRGALLLPCAGVGAAAGGVEGALLGLGAASAGTFLIGQRVLYARCRSYGIKIDLRASFEREAVATSLSLWGGALLQAGSNWLVTLLLSRPPAGLVQLGLFNAAEKFRAALAFVPNLLFQVTLPMLSRSYASQDQRSCRRVVYAVVACTLVVTGSGVVAVAVFAGTLMASYGPGFGPGEGVLRMVAVGSIASALYTVGSGVLWALGKPGRMLAIDGLKTFLLVALCAAGFAATAWHAALAYLVSFAAAGVLLLAAVRRTLAAAPEKNA